MDHWLRRASGVLGAVSVKGFYVLSILAIVQSILNIIQVLAETNLEELKALPDPAKAARALQMAQEQAEVRTFWQPVINGLMALAAKFPVPPAA